MQVWISCFKRVCNLFNLTSLINKATCYKNPNKPSSIDLLLTNFPKNFQNSSVVETGLSNFHKIAVTVMKTNFWKLEPKVINYGHYRYFSNDRFKEKVTSESSKAVLEKRGIRVLISSLLYERKPLICMFHLKRDI